MANRKKPVIIVVQNTVADYQIVPNIKWIDGKVREGFKIVGKESSLGMFKNIASARAFIKEVGGRRLSRVKRNHGAYIAPQRPPSEIDEGMEWIKERFM